VNSIPSLQLGPARWAHPAQNQPSGLGSSVACRYQNNTEDNFFKPSLFHRSDPHAPSLSKPDTRLEFLLGAAAMEEKAAKIRDRSIYPCPARWAAKAPSSQRSWHRVGASAKRMRRNNVNRARRPMVAPTQKPRTSHTKPGCWQINDDTPRRFPAKPLRQGQTDCGCKG
jgi:hypothetical protein